MSLMINFQHLRLMQKLKLYRYYSTITGSVEGYYSIKQLAIDDNNVYHLELNNRPVNTLNITMLQKLTTLFTDLCGYRNSPTNALIISSAIQHVFSAGLDLKAMLLPDNTTQSLSNYWDYFQKFWLTFYSCPFPVVILVNGECPAAGCLIAMTGDYRIMLNSKYTIGITATKVGIVPPFWIYRLMSQLIGPRQTDLSISTGRLYNPKEALSIGLIDEIATDQEEGMHACIQAINMFTNIDKKTREACKIRFRQDLITEFNRRRSEDKEHFIEMIKSDSFQNNIRRILNRK